MRDKIDRHALRRGLLVQRLLWVFMALALGVIFAVAHLLRLGLRPGLFVHDNPVALLRIVFVSLTLIELPIASRLRCFVVQGGSGGLLQKIFPPLPLAGRKHPVVAEYQAMMMLCLAFAVSVGIYGMVLYLCGDPPAVLYIFHLIAAAALVFFRPRKKEMEQMAVQMQARSAQAV